MLKFFMVIFSVVDLNLSCYSYIQLCFNADTLNLANSFHLLHQCQGKIVDHLVDQLFD